MEMSQLNPAIKFYPADELAKLEDIRAFETEIGFSFPLDYVEFLLTFNGPEFEPSNAILAGEDPTLLIRTGFVDGRRFEDLDVACFLGIERREGNYGLVQQYRTITEYWGFPRCMIPIANSVGSEKIYLNLQGRPFAKVMVVGDPIGAKLDAGEMLNPESFVVVAESFTDFICRLFWKNTQNPVL